MSKVVLDSVPDAVIVINVEDYTILDANRALLEALKLTKEEVVGKTCFEVVHGRSVLCAAPDDVCPIQEMLKTGKPVTVEHTHYDKDGTPIYVEVSVSPIRDSEGKITQAAHISRDITKRRQAEQALKVSEEKYRSLFTSMLNGFAYCKIILGEKGEPVDFVYLDVNDVFERLTGLKKTDVLGRKVTEAIPGIKEANPELFDIYGRVALTGKEENFETYIKPLHIWLSISVHCPEKGYFVATFDNITQRKRMEKALWLRAELLDSASDMMFLRNFDGATVYVNETACRIMGYSREELMKMNVRELVTPEYASSIETQIKELMKKGSLMFESAQICKDGSVLPVEIHACVLERNNQKFTQAVIRDITERKKAEELVQESAKKLKNFERLATIGATAGMVGHDIRNPLQAIINDLYLVKSDISSVPNSEEKKNALESLDEIGNNVLYINKIVTDLQDFVRQINPVAKETSLQSIVDDVLKMSPQASRLKSKCKKTQAQ